MVALKTSLRLKKSTFVLFLLFVLAGLSLVQTALAQELEPGPKARSVPPSAKPETAGNERDTSVPELKPNQAELPETKAEPADDSQYKNEKKTDAEKELKAAIESAIETANQLKQQFDEAQRLAELGSVSQPELRRANFNYKLALLNVIELEEPSAKREIELARAKLELELTTKELETITTLYQRGSATELEFQQATVAQQIAKLGLKAIEDGDGEKLYRIKIAQSNLVLAKEVHSKAVRLFKTRSISDTVYEQVEVALREAEDELELAKKDLGVVVKQVPTGVGG